MLRNRCYFRSIFWAGLFYFTRKTILIQQFFTKTIFQISDPLYSNVVNSFDYLEVANRKILNYGWVSFPLAYTQVANLSVLAYMTASLLGSQYLIPSDKMEQNYTMCNFTVANMNFLDKVFEKHTPDFVFPWFAVFQFVSYVGWIQVAEALLNPFGDDDEGTWPMSSLQKSLSSHSLVTPKSLVSHL